MRTEGERMREFAAYVRMMAAQRQAMGATVEQFVNDLDLMATGSAGWRPTRCLRRGSVSLALFCPFILTNLVHYEVAYRKPMAGGVS